MTVFKEPTCCVVDVGAGPLADSPSSAAVLPNSRQPVALWDAALGSLDLLENRFLKETETGLISVLVCGQASNQVEEPQHLSFISKRASSPCLF